MKSLFAKRKWRSDEPSSSSVAAAAALSAVALLGGGVAAAKVWRLLGEEPGAPPELRQIAARIKAGYASAAALAAAGGPEWRVLAAAWSLAEQSGAPLARVLNRIVDALISLERLGERRAVLLSGPRATIRLVGTLPIAALVVGAFLGFDPIEVLLSPIGAMLGVTGGLLLLAGVHWAKKLTDRLAAAEWVAGLECELCWIALSGGASPQLALRRVADQVDRIRVEWVRLSALRRDGAVQGVLQAAAAHGTSAGSMLLAEATGARSRVLASLEQEAEKLAVKILLPIGLCVLPSFVVLGVLPVLLAVMGSIGPVA